MNFNRPLNDEEQALLDLLLDPSYIEDIAPADVDAELKALGMDPHQEPMWRRRALAYLERELAFRTGTNANKVTATEPARGTVPTRSLLGVEIVPSAGRAEFGAAASHKAFIAATKRRRFLLRWKQGEHEWAMEGLSADSGHELVLSSPDAAQARSITWKSPTTGRADTLRIEARTDGTYLVVGISLALARKRVEVLRDMTDVAAQTDLLPTVQIVEDAM